MEVERLFFIYAFPAIGECGKVSESVKSRLEKLVHNGSAPRKEEMQEFTPMAFKRMKDKIGEDYWTEEGVRRYWWVEHNRIIENMEEGYENSLPAHRENCKINFWEVLDVKEDFVELVNRSDKNSRAINYMHLKLKKGDYVTTHKSHVVERVNYKDFMKYG